MPVPHWVLFDLYGTLLDPARLVEPWGPPPDHRPSALAALDDATMNASIDRAAGEFRPFGDYLEPALARRVAMKGLDPERAHEGVRMATKLAPFPDARPALERLRHNGCRLAVVTSNTAGGGEKALQHAGLISLIDEVVSGAEVEAHKPDVRVYRHALKRLGAKAATTAHVTGHWWDAVGAQRAGLRAVWVWRDEREWPSPSDPPADTAPNLAGAAACLMA
jgi:2-haloalkanoic acid dehalogenase type II